MPIQDLFGPITTRTRVIENFDSFILGNVPYGRVDPKHVRWGGIEYDGPRAPGMIGSKAALQWHFGGVPYPITRAVRVTYSYERQWDGSGETVTDTILLGFQASLEDHVRAQPIPLVSNYSQTYFARRDNLGTFGGSTNDVWASQPAILASEATGLVTAALPGATDSQWSFDALIQMEFGRGDTPVGAFHRCTGMPLGIDFDGPAQDSDSHNPFPYTPATLFNAPEKYAQVLIWYYAGGARRVTKAMRIPIQITSTEPVPPAQPGLAGPGVAGPVPWRAEQPTEAVEQLYAQTSEASPPEEASLAQLAQTLGDAPEAVARAEALTGYALFIGYTSGGATSGA